MSEYPPIEARTTKKSGIAGCLVAALVGSGLLVVLAVSAVLLIGWRLTREGPASPPLAMRDGSESFFLHATLRADDPGVAAFIDDFFNALRRAETAKGRANRSPLVDSRQAEGLRTWLPIEIDVARANRDGGTPDAAVVAAHFPAKAAMVRALFRIAATFIPTRTGAAVRRTEIDGTQVLYAAPSSDGPKPRVAIALLGDGLVGARELADLQAALRHTVANIEADEPSSLARTIRLDSEDGWGYTRPRDPEATDDVDLAVFSFDLQPDRIVKWRAAVRGDRPAADRVAAERSMVTALTSVSLPEGLRLTLDGTRRWADDRTLLIEGTVDGIDEFLGGLFESDSADAPGAPTPPTPGKDVPSRN